MGLVILSCLLIQYNGLLRADELVANKTLDRLIVDTHREKITSIEEQQSATVTTSTTTHVEAENDIPVPRSQSYNSTQIYIITVIGVTPAIIGAFVWWLKNARPRCLRRKRKFGPDNSPRPDMSRNIHWDNKGRSEVRPYRENDAAPQRNGNDVQSSPSLYMKSRRVYTIEFPRRHLNMVEIIGEGNFGQVWKAVVTGQTDKDKVVAVKTNKANATESDWEDLLKELDTMLQLGSHPNVVRIIGCCTEAIPFYLIIEYARGGKLLSFLRDHRTTRKYYNHNPLTATSVTSKHSPPSSPSSPYKSITSNDLVKFSYQIARGMEFISSHGIIHRDLAARNILLDSNNQCKVADFGLARSIRDKDDDVYEQKTKGLMPVRWMSPESLYMSVFTTKSDVWSFGILLWEIVSLGSTPFPGVSAGDVIKRVKDGIVMNKPEHCSDEFFRFMNTCWCLEPLRRPTFSHLKNELSSMLLNQNNYIDLDVNLPDNVYYNIYNSPGEKV